MPRPPIPTGSAVNADPLAGVERVFIDGSNLLYALARGSGSRRQGGVPRGPDDGPGGLAPAGAIIGRLRASFPPSVSVELVFDGPAHGGIKGRLATGLRVSYSGRASADSIIFEGVAAQLAADGPAGTWGILVVTDDRGLRDLVTARGARVAGTAWLAGRIGRIGEERPGAAGAGRLERASRPARSAAPEGRHHDRASAAPPRPRRPRPGPIEPRLRPTATGSDVTARISP